ncbi:MAG: hypothetical protein KC635_20910, partial [Myxococcales bacterium]|nr:hypothetical protein [Myxococcales bacterium]
MLPNHAAPTSRRAAARVAALLGALAAIALAGCESDGSISTCASSSDCENGGACVNGACQVAGTCTDGARNGQETGVDCGG